MRAVIACVVAGVMLAALPASAQDPEKRVHIHFGSGPTITTGDVNTALGQGYNLNFGVTVNVNPKVGILFEYSYNGLGQKQLTTDFYPTPPIDGGTTATRETLYGDMNMQYGNFSAVFRPVPSNRLSPYLIGGGGIYYRPVKITTPGAGYVPGYCDPFWYYCTPGGWVPVENIVGSRSSTDFGINLGGGVNFRVAESASVFVEMRYHYIWGPKYTYTDSNQQSVTKDANSAFYPITFGVRF